MPDDYDGPERRSNHCEGCPDDRALLQRMAGANKVRNWLIGVLVFSVLGSGVFVRADSTQVALNAQAIAELKEQTKQNAEAISEVHEQQEMQTQRILDAIEDIGR